MLAAHDVVSAGRRSSPNSGPSCVTCRSAVVGAGRAACCALAAHNEMVVIAGLSGVLRADGEVLAGGERLGGELDVDAASIQPATGTAVWSVSDADDEVRVVVRGIVDAMRDGVSLERMAVVLGNTEPYARLLHDHLALAGITHNGVSVRTLADSVLGRSLLRLLALPDHDFRRDDVFALLARVPLLDGHGQAAPAVAWERLSRRTQAWSAASPSGRRGSRTTSPCSKAATMPTSSRRRVAGEQACTFPVRCQRVAGRPRARRARGPELAAWATALIRRWIGSDEHVRTNWRSPFEQEAARRVEAAVDRLGGLDSVESRPTLEVFRRSLAPRARRRAAIASGRLGEGLLVGFGGAHARRGARPALGVRAGRGRVPGAAPRRSAALRRRSRRTGWGAADARRSHHGDDQRALLADAGRHQWRPHALLPAAICAATPSMMPSRFLARHHRGVVRRPSAARGARRGAGWYTCLPSYVHGLAHAAFPATEHEFDVRAALAGDPAIARCAAVARGARPRAVAAEHRPSPASTAISRTCGAAGRAGAVGAREARCRLPGSRSGRGARTRTSCEYLPCTCSRSSAPKRSSSSRRSRRATSCTPRSTASSPSCTAVAGAGRPWSGRASRAHARRPARCL